MKLVEMLNGSGLVVLHVLQTLGLLFFLYEAVVSLLFYLLKIPDCGSGLQWRWTMMLWAPHLAHLHLSGLACPGLRRFRHKQGLNLCVRMIFNARWHHLEK